MRKADNMKAVSYHQIGVSILPRRCLSTAKMFGSLSLIHHTISIHEISQIPTLSSRVKATVVRGVPQTHRSQLPIES